jgi:hypothetical protein
LKRIISASANVTRCYLARKSCGCKQRYNGRGVVEFRRGGSARRGAGEFHKGTLLGLAPDLFLRKFPSVEKRSQ